MRRTQAANVAAVAAIEKRPVKHALPNVAAVDHLGSSSASRSLFASSRVDPTGGSAKEAWLRCRAACRLLSAITRAQSVSRLAGVAARGRKDTAHSKQHNDGVSEMWAAAGASHHTRRCDVPSKKQHLLPPRPSVSLAAATTTCWSFFRTLICDTRSCRVSWIAVSPSPPRLAQISSGFGMRRTRATCAGFDR